VRAALWILTRDPVDEHRIMAYATGNVPA